MDVQFVNPFIEAAYSVLEAEAGVTAQRGKIALQRSAATADDVTVLISMVGEVKGVVLYGLSERTAINLVSRILGQPFDTFDDLAQSGIGEIGNVITGQASNRIAAAGFEVNISTPTMILGKGSKISTFDMDRLIVPLETEYGVVTLSLALREEKNNGKMGVQLAL
jgi:chemotaxis protein CheX